MKALTKEQMHWQRVYDCHEPGIVFLRVFAMRDTLEAGRQRHYVDLDEPPSFVNIANCDRLIVDGRRRPECRGKKCKGIGYDDAERLEFVQVHVKHGDEWTWGAAIREEAEDASARCGVYCDASAPREGEER